MNNNDRTIGALVGRIEKLETELRALKGLDKKQEKPVLSEADILKLICDKIPKDNKTQLTNKDVIDIINKHITVDFINKRYGK